MKRSLRGFTLTELMIVVALIGILAAFAYPAYQNYVREARRADGHSALSRIAAQQERYFSDNNSYVADLTALGYPSATPLSPDGHYQITAVVGAGTYSLSAAAQGPQADDTDCDPMTLNQLGQKAPAACW